MIARVCLGPDCARLVTGTTRCDEHQAAHASRVNAQRRERRGTTAARGYGAAWQAISRRRRRLHPICELRLAGCTIRATEVDHTVPLRAGGRSSWDNARSACHACNNAKRAADLERWPLSTYPEKG